MGGEVHGKTFDNIVSIIRYFIETRRYGPVDRMAMAMGPESVETALYDILRALDTLYAKSILVKLRTQEGREYSRIRCCEYGENLGYGIKGVIEEVYDGPRELKGQETYCQPCPSKPSESEIKEFLETIDKDLSIARKTVLRAFGRRGG